MNEVVQAAADLQAICQAESWRFCFIGGIAGILDQLEALRMEFEQY